MKKATKVLLLVLCAILLVVGSVAGTLAYLTSRQTVTNTFSVGQVEITMVETKVDEYGKTDGTTTVTTTDTNTYKLVPGGEYVKDPTITVTKGSEPCWLFIQLKNDIAAFEEQNNAEKPTIAQQLATNGWKPIATGSSVYYHEVVDARTAAHTVKVFEKFWISGTANTDNATSWAAVTPDNTKVTVVAYAIQSNGLTTYSNAWDALSTQLGLS